MANVTCLLFKTSCNRIVFIPIQQASRPNAVTLREIFVETGDVANEPIWPIVRMFRRIALHFEQARHQLPADGVPSVSCCFTENEKSTRRAHTDPALKASRNASLDFWIDRLGQFAIGPIVHEDFRVLGCGVEVIHEHPFSEAVAKSNEESGWEASVMAFEPSECWCNWYGSGGREISD